ncbi:hypothetical protein [Sphingomonas sp. BK580]|uniref:hypothetical protein n=1 Tax=Sphingomonas sp. BK580 TaxID=2586972 RepID=UPI0016157B6C|nr:hypothetical protein [Sphingomonas sp. BK580]MBB3695256.1 hypothetical protein [Sphingomonas sp. BK580]
MASDLTEAMLLKGHFGYPADLLRSYVAISCKNRKGFVQVTLYRSTVAGGLSFSPDRSVKLRCALDRVGAASRRP